MKSAAVPLLAAAMLAGAELRRVEPNTEVPDRDLVTDGAPRIVTNPDVLHLPSLPYRGPFGDDLKRLTDQMFAAMYASRQGVGLAAVQIGIHLRVCVVDVYALAEDQGRRLPRVFVNPLIQLAGKPLSMREGCLSAPGIFGDVPRAPGVRAIWENEAGELCHDELGGLLAHILQHEVDHMDGVLCTSKMERGQ